MERVSAKKATVGQPTVALLGTRTLAPARPAIIQLRFVATEFASRGSRATISSPASSDATEFAASQTIPVCSFFPGALAVKIGLCQECAGRSLMPGQEVQARENPTAGPV